MITGNQVPIEDSSGPTVVGEFVEALTVSVLTHELSIILEELGFWISKTEIRVSILE